MYHSIDNENEALIFYETLAQRMDFSCVRAIHDKEELRHLVKIAKNYRPACVFVLPSLTDWLSEQLKEVSSVRLGGVVSFPSGGDAAEEKVFQARELIRKGCGELDMVMNLTLLRLGEFDRCMDDIRRVVDSAGNIPVKVIIEAALLTDDEICRASETTVKAGAAFVKTGTGWNGPATLRQVQLIYRTIGDAANIKAAGGIRTLKTVKELYEAGCDRFGVSAGAAEEILKQAADLKSS